MSRIGKKPVVIPSGVEATLSGAVLSVKGPKGTLSLTIHPKVSVSINGSEILVDVAKKEDKKEKALWGLSRSLVQNIVEGVEKGFEKKLEVNGVGFKVATAGSKLTMSLGFSHPVEVEIPSDLQVSVEKNVITVFEAIPNRNDDNELVKDLLQIKPAPYRFYKRMDINTRLTNLVFGAGNAESSQDDIIPDPSDLALPL
jgi:large subunit ribosomal protein L6